MHRDRTSLVLIFLVTAVAVAAAALLTYHFATRVDELAGRRDPAELYADPTLLFTDPGILGSAVELRVTEAVAACMAEAGFDYRGPAVIAGWDELLDPGADGYGVTTGREAPRPLLGAGGPGEAGSAAYEEALYGAALSGNEGTAAGCSAAGRAALDGALAALDAMPYSLEQLEADAAGHPAWLAALRDWSACMADRGFSASSPEDLIASFTAALSGAAGDNARALAEGERAAAEADFACREATLNPALAQVATSLGPVFLQRNRPQLEALVPPPPGARDEGLGTGDVQLTLLWHSMVDLDLAVTDPSGVTIDYTNRTPPSGGQLDRDANYPCASATANPVENIFWPPGGAPPGRYVVTVAYRTGCGTSPGELFELVVRLDGDIVHDGREALDPGSSYSFEFDYGGDG